MSTLITYNPQDNILGKHVAKAAKDLLLAKQELDLAVAVVEQATAFGSDTAALEAMVALGLPSGKGQAFYDNVTNLRLTLNSVTNGQLAILYQGTDNV